jgi:hypothetical protein
MEHTCLHPYHPDFYHKLSSSELIDAMGKEGRFSNLKIFLTKKDIGALGKPYLMVSRNDFNIIRLLDFNYENEKVILDLQDTKTNKITQITIDIYETKFQYLFLNLKDIKDMIHEEIHPDGAIEDLLELDEG